MFACNRCKVHLCGTDRSGHALPRHILDPASRSIANSYRVCGMPLFVTLRKGYRLDEALRQRIRTQLRREYSPRHVPDEIIEFPGIPQTVLEAFIAYAQSRSTDQGAS